MTEFDKRKQTYYTYYREVQQPGYTDTDKVVRHEVNIFTPQEDGGRLVWSGTGELMNPSSREEIRHEISDMVIPELSHQGIIQSK